MTDYIETDRESLTRLVKAIAAGERELRFGGLVTQAAGEEIALELAEHHEDLATQADGADEECGPGHWADRAKRERARAAIYAGLARRARTCEAAGHWVVTGRDRCSSCGADMAPVDSEEIPRG